MFTTYIEKVCELLNIESPLISYDTSHFPTTTMMAQYNPDNNTIFIKHCNKPNPDQCFAIAHELRHIWQIKTDKSLYLKDYKTVDLCKNVEEYNLQLAEIDANAYAGFIMINMFGLQPLFEGMNEKVKKKIEARIQYITECENPL